MPSCLCCDGRHPSSSCCPLPSTSSHHVSRAGNTNAMAPNPLSAHPRPTLPASRTPESLLGFVFAGGQLYLHPMVCPSAFGEGGAGVYQLARCRGNWMSTAKTTRLQKIPSTTCQTHEARLEQGCGDPSGEGWGGESDSPNLANMMFLYMPALFQILNTGVCIPCLWTPSCTKPHHIEFTATCTCPRLVPENVATTLEPETCVKPFIICSKRCVPAWAPGTLARTKFPIMIPWTLLEI
jgi:hypothetical protein